MDNFIKIYNCDIYKYRVFLNASNAEVLKKFNQITRTNKTLNKFVLVIEAVKINAHNKQQFNYEDSCDLGDIYAIKIDTHRFYTLVAKELGYRNLFISRYGRKQTQKNDKKLLAIIKSISKIEITKIFKDE